jgi:hypothetical protein
MNWINYFIENCLKLGLRFDFSTPYHYREEETDNPVEFFFFFFFK